MTSRVLGLFVAVGVYALGGVISLQPPAASVTHGKPLSLDVNVSGVADLYAFQFDVRFDPAILSAVSVSEGNLFSGVGVFFSPGAINNTSGTITFIADSLAGPGSGISANGSLAKILFNTIGEGTSKVNLTNVVLLDSGLGDIIVEVADSTATVTPEPSVGGLLGTVLLAAVGARRFRTSSRQR
mgnify:CR=1 FL=1